LFRKRNRRLLYKYLYISWRRIWF